MKPVLIVKTGNTVKGIPSEWGDFEHWIGAGLGRTDCLVVDVSTGARPPAPETVAGIVITGSAAMVSERLGWSENAAKYLRTAVELAVPTLGICYGHQLLAHALGGAVDYHPRGREIGTTTVTLTAEAAAEPLFDALPPSFPAHVTHKQSITRLPPDAVVLAGNDFEPYHALRFGERAWGVQFHPEFSADVMRVYLRERRADLVAEGMDVEGLEKAVTETPAAGSLLRRFADMLG